MSKGIHSLADLRPGDLMFTGISGLIPGVFPVKLGQLMLGERVRLGPVSVDHVGVVTQQTGFPQGRLVQAMPNGAEEITLSAARHWNAHTMFVRIPEDYPGQADDAAAIARLFVTEKVPYSFASYAALAAWHWGFKAERLAKWIDRRRPSAITLPQWSAGLGGHPRGGRLPEEAICSVLADQAWTLAGKQVMHGTAKQVVTPGRLFLSLWDRPGVIRGGGHS